MSVWLSLNNVDRGWERVTYRVENNSYPTSESADQIPVWLLHARGVAVLCSISSTKTPNESSYNHDWKDESEGSSEHCSC